MKVKMLTSMAGINFAYQVNQVVDIKDTKEAERLISAGVAVKYSEPKKNSKAK